MWFNCYMMEMILKIMMMKKVPVINNNMMINKIYCDSHYVDSSDENELDMTSSRNNSTQTGRGLRKTVLNNVDRLLNTGNKQNKL